MKNHLQILFCIIFVAHLWSGSWSCAKDPLTQRYSVIEITVHSGHDNSRSDVLTERTTMPGVDVGDVNDLEKPSSPSGQSDAGKDAGKKDAASGRGTLSANSGAQEHFIHLGEVRVYNQKIATFAISNPSTMPLRIAKFDVLESVNQTWLPISWRRPDEAMQNSAESASASEMSSMNSARDAADVGDDSSATLSSVSMEEALIIKPYQTMLIDIAFEARHEGSAFIRLDVESNAINGKNQQLLVAAEGIYQGEPDIELDYGTYQHMPLSEDCQDNGHCLISDKRAFDLGMVGVGQKITAGIILRNTAQCDPLPDGPACRACELRIEAQPEGQNLGLGFKQDTNADELFAFIGSTQTPFAIAQSEESCGNNGEQPLLLSFKGSESIGDFHTTLVIESIDPDEGVIELPIRAQVRPCPLAIATLRPPDPNNLSAPFSTTETIEPLKRVYFDGTQSHDPQDTSGSLTRYQWEVIEQPSGVNPMDYQIEGQNTPYFSFWVPIAGHYKIRLRVENEAGISSCEDARNYVDIDAVPSSRLHVQLVWDDQQNDQDLHLLHQDKDSRMCNNPWDCFFQQ